MQYDVNQGLLQVIIEGEEINAVVGEAAQINVGEAINYIRTGTEEIEQAVQEGITEFNGNAVEKTNEFDLNAQNKTSDFNSNATQKTLDFNSNASDKTSDFNLNAQEKTSEFNANAVEKTNDFNSNAQDKTGDFNDNAVDKTTDFNDNYTAKKALIDAQVGVAESAATTATTQAGLAKQWAIGDPSEPTGNSAKYWAEQASSTLSGLTTRVSTIEGKIPSAASSSNQLADKDWVENKGYITGITSGDVTTALGYTPYNSSNPDGYQTASDVATAISGKQDTLTAGTNIQITNNVISATDTTYTAGTGIAINNGVISNTQTSAEWGNISGTLSNQTDLQNALNGKQETLVSGTNIKTINSNSILGSGDLTVTAQVVWGSITGTLSNQTDLDTALSGKLATDLSNIVTAGQEALVDLLYPVGSIYIGTTSTCPLAAIKGTWTLKSSGRVLQGSDSNHTAGTTIEAGLPNITGVSSWISTGSHITSNSKAFGKTSYTGGGYTNYGNATNYSLEDFDASRSNSIYGNSPTVQPPAYVVNIWERTA